MAKAPEKEIELRPDAWERFDRVVSIVTKSPPQHRKAKKAAPKKRAKKKK
jgi:hypothetical protein